MGAHLAVPNGAISEADQADLSIKVSIAYMEAQEPKYWLCLLKDANYLDDKAFDSHFADGDEVAAILFAILKESRLSK